VGRQLRDPDFFRFARARRKNLAHVVDRRWNLLCVNRGATKFVEFLTGPAPVVPVKPAVTLT
jgi:hypothetical protein